MTLSEAIARARAKKRFSLRELSRITGVQNSHLSEMETGRRPNPPWLTLVKVAKVLDVKLDPLVRAAAGIQIEGT
jgi:transcriptional regulator with XRE-family HTH domain